MGGIICVGSYACHGGALLVGYICLRQSRYVGWRSPLPLQNNSWVVNPRRAVDHRDPVAAGSPLRRTGPSCRPDTCPACAAGPGCGARPPESLFRRGSLRGIIDPVFFLVGVPLKQEMAAKEFVYANEHPLPFFLTARAWLHEFSGMLLFDN